MTTAIFLLQGAVIISSHLAAELPTHFRVLASMEMCHGLGSLLPSLSLLATTHLSELRLTRLALFTVTHLHKLSIASAIQPQFNPLILPACALLTHSHIEACY